MKTPISSWDNDYARLARATSLLRADLPIGTSFNSAQQWQDKASSIQIGLDRLFSHLYYHESHLSLSPAEVSRRRSLLEGLKDQLSYESVSGADYSGRLPSPAAALRQQENTIDEIAIGVDGIKKRTKIINEEIDSHLILFGKIDNNTELGKEVLEDVTRRTKSFRRENRKTLWRLHLIAAGLGVLLFLLILMGLF
mmetsp:Transcript_26131/g.55582  ORF Transcript_26131/g.55582 Transcript_26131/m.55582 type:complete len:196 (+) Transcript_26131:117-704(+)